MTIKPLGTHVLVKVEEITNQEGSVLALPTSQKNIIVIDCGAEVKFVLDAGDHLIIEDGARLKPAGKDFLIEESDIIGRYV